MANLGERQALKAEVKHQKPRRMETAWLDKLANLCDEEEEIERKKILEASIISRNPITI